jgi:hypothetical protein
VGGHRHDEAALLPGRGRGTYGTGGQPRVCTSGVCGDGNRCFGVVLRGVTVTRTNSLYRGSRGR